MIGKLVGTLIEKSPGLVLVDVSGVGYEVEVSLTTYVNLPENGEQTMLDTHLVVREDAQLLFGFLTRKERDLFRVLIKVNGVGPKLGLAILSGMDTLTFARCVKNNDVASLVSLPGVGKKTAERLVIEVRDKIENWAEFESGLTPPVLRNESSLKDVEAALIGLGYRPQDAARALALIGTKGGEQVGEESTEKSSELSVEYLLKQALRVLSN